MKSEVEESIRYALPKMAICRCGSIPKLIGWNNYEAVLECEFCKARITGGELQ